MPQLEWILKNYSDKRAGQWLPGPVKGAYAGGQNFADPACGV